ncbi:MAG: hypothetical protein HQ557_14370 [Bacteroidetes bacterium]|nr:hypothetical protein [Bacteroidota bacterium]
MMIAQGQPVKAVSEDLGHADTAVTQDMYVYVKLEHKELPQF